MFLNNLHRYPPALSILLPSKGLVTSLNLQQEFMMIKDNLKLVLCQLDKMQDQSFLLANRVLLMLLLREKLDNPWKQGLE